MARHQVSDGGDGLQMYWVPASALNKHSCTADKGCSSNLGVGLEPNDALSLKEKLVTECYAAYQTLTDSLG
jgi:hypothetical protein